MDLMSNQAELRDQLSSGALCDALDAAGMWSVLPQSIHNVSNVRRNFFGRAYTVSWVPTRKQSDIRASTASTWSQVREFLIPAERDVSGMVYVAGAQNGCVERFALAGGLSTQHFEKLGMEAVVLFGAIRDAADVAQRALPIFATGFSPMDSQGNYRVASAGTECMVADICVRTGDWVFGDATGVVLLPAPIAADIVTRALAIRRTESSVEEQLRGGDSLMSVLDRAGHI